MPLNIYIYVLYSLELLLVSPADHMDPGPDEVQVAWEDGAVENVNCRGLKLGGSPPVAKGPLRSLFAGAWGDNI